MTHSPQSGDRPDAADRSHGYAEGFELGKLEGRRLGEADGSAAARAHAEDALRRALDTQQRDSERKQSSATAQTDALRQRLEQLQADFQVAATSRLRSLEDDATALAFEAVCRLVGEHAGQHEQLARSIAVAMQRAREGSILRVRVRPDALPLLDTSALGRSLMRESGAVQWVADPRVAGDGCILDTETGSIDARMETQLDQLRRLWSSAIEQGKNDAAGALSA